MSRLRPAVRRAAIVGIGETDYQADYKARRANSEHYQKTTQETLVDQAFSRALADAGLTRADVDGLTVSYPFGGLDPQSTANMLGIQPRLLLEQPGIMAGPLPNVCQHLSNGDCTTVAMIYGYCSKASRRVAVTDEDSERSGPASYTFYNPWGWGSQASHWAMVAAHYKASFALEDDFLASVAISLRENARQTDSAIMRDSLSRESYMSSRLVVSPLRLLDICLVSEGAVCLIVTTEDRARDLPQPPVTVAGWGEAKARGDALDMLVTKRLRPLLQDALREALEMADLDLSEIGHFEGYDAASIHLISQIEGYGMAKPGNGASLFDDHAQTRSGTLPINTSGGMLSGAAMHGWNQVVEIVRQLRGSAGGRQIKGLAASLFSLAQTDQVNPIIFTGQEQ